MKVYILLADDAHLTCISSLLVSAQLPVDGIGVINFTVFAYRAPSLYGRSNSSIVISNKRSTSHLSPVSTD